MSHAPFDGILLDDPRPPVPGALAVALHLRVERGRAALARRPPLALEALLGRASACRELLAQGLLPPQLRALGAHGLELGDPRQPFSLASLAEHLEGYLAAVDGAGYLEPEAALWAAVDAELAGRRGVWVERSPEDGPLEAGWRDLAPARLRALACLPEVGPVVFRLAARRGDGSSGLFGSGAPSLTAWMLEGLEAHGGDLPGDLTLAAPEGWAESCPWASALEGLFEGPLELGEAAQVLRRGLASSPAELLFAAVEQVCAWVDQGLAPEDIVLVYPDPALVGPFLRALLEAEGLVLQVRGAPAPLARHRAWEPLFAVIEGLAEEDPVRVAAGLRAGGKLPKAATALEAGDEVGPRAFDAAGEAGRLAVLRNWRTLRLPPAAWADRLEEVALQLGLAAPGDPFFGALGLLREGWASREVWDFDAMRVALEAFLRTATDPAETEDAPGLRLVSWTAPLEPGFGCKAALALDLREGVWPALPAPSPDLDWSRKGALNRALQAQGLGPGGFPSALQRFWLPTAEGTEQVPRLLQREAYAFNALLALTEEAFLALSPAQDEEGRPQAQGPFWTALEGAGGWAPDPRQARSRLRFLREAQAPAEIHLQRALSTLPRPEEMWPEAAAPEADRIENACEAWARDCVSPTALQELARCPFRAYAQRAWGLREEDPASQLRLDQGSLLHSLLQAALAPFVGAPHWPQALEDALGAEAGPETLEDWLEGLWDPRAEGWAAGLATPQALRPRLLREARAQIPQVAAYLLRELEAEGPAPWEARLLDPALRDGSASPKLPLEWKGGWRRTLLGVEHPLGPAPFGGFTIAGTADRLERWSRADRTFLRVVDYKDSKNLKPYAEGDAPFRTHLQPALYAALASRELGLPATALLVPLRAESPAPWDKALEPLAAEEDWTATLETCVSSLKDRLDRGDLPPVPGPHCTRCHLAALCGRPVEFEADEA